MYRKKADTKLKRNLLRVDNSQKYDRVRWPSRDEYRRRKLKEERIRISVRKQSYCYLVQGGYLVSMCF